MSKNICNHCNALKLSAESSIRLEIKLKDALEHIKEKELEQMDHIARIKQLEQQIAQLQESQKQKSIIKLCERLDKAEQQNKELRKTLKQCMIWLQKESKSMPNYNITQSVLWQSFEEMLDTGGER